MRRRELLVNKANGGGAGTDVLFVKNDTLEKRIFGKSEYPSESEWTPIGIVVVPSSHNRYGDGICSVMSLGLIHPSGAIQTNGAEDRATMTWGAKDEDTSLANYRTVDGSNTYGYVPFQTNSGSTSCSFFSAPQLQYPYTTLNGTDVKPYYVGSLSDYNGIGNTNILNSSSHPAAYACKQVSTLGTSKGDWYLPACGELAYLPSIRYEVNKTISSLQSIYGSVGSLLNLSDYLSSTEFGSSHVWQISLGYGKVYDYYKVQGAMVRAFLRFKTA